MAMTLLQLVQAVCREVALESPNAVASSSDQQVLQMYALASDVGRELLDMPHDWQALITEGSFTTDATGYSALPSAYHRMLNRTQWDRTNDWPLVGPILPQGWQWLKSSGLANTGPRVRFRIQGGRVNYHPATEAGTSYYYEYIRNTWVIDTDGSTYKAAFAADTDTCVFRDRVMIAGIKYKFLSAKGLDTQAAARDYSMAVEAQMGQESGAPALSLSSADMGPTLIDQFNIPDSGFGS